MIHIGFEKETAKSVGVPLQHTILAGITRYGKSTTLSHMIESIPENYKILLLDVKRPRDYQGSGVEVPIYLEDRTEPVGLKNLLESSGKMGLKFEFAELIKVCKKCAAVDRQGRYGFRDVYEGITEALKDKIHPIRESKLLVLQHLLSRLIKELDETKISDQLILPERINVMNLSHTPRMVKQLAVYSTFKWILDNLQNIIIVLDELPDFAPQRHGTPAREIIVHAVRKGGASGIWCWLAGQTVTGVDKSVLKQCNYWILGRQREKNEAKRTLDQIPFKTGLSWKDVMKLPVGHFVVVSENAAYITYVQPPGIDASIAEQVATGKISVTDVSKRMKKKESDTDLVYKEKYEKAMQELKTISERLRATEKQRNDLQEKLDSLADYEEEIKRLKKKNAELDREIESTADLVEAAETLKSALSMLLPSEITTPKIVAHPEPSFGLAQVDERFKQILAGKKEIKVVEVPIDDRLKENVKQTVVGQIIKKIKSLPGPAKKAAPFLYYQRETSVGDLNNFLYDKKGGRPSGAFYNNAVIPLEDAKLIKREGNQITWCLEESLKSELNLSPKELENARKYILTFLL